MGEHVTALLASAGKAQLEKTRKEIEQAREAAKAEYARLKDEKSVAKARAAAKVQYQRLGKDLAQVEAALAQHNGSKQAETTKPDVIRRGPGGKFVKESAKKAGAATKKGSQKAPAPAPAEQQEQEQDNRPQEEDDASRQAVADARS